MSRSHKQPRIPFVVAGPLILLLLTLILVAALAQTGAVEVRVPFFGQDTSNIPIQTDTEPQFLQEQEVVVIEQSDEEGAVILPVEKVLFEYVEVVDGCSAHYEDECLNVRSGPGTEYPIISQLRNGIVLKVGGKVEHDEKTWYKIVFDEWLRYPDRVGGDWYVAADYVEILLDEGEKNEWDHGSATTTKEIIVVRSEQKLYAYEDGELFMELSISTGLELTPTPRGEFTVFKKTPSRYMQGPIPGIAEQYYDMPGVPWNLYFTHGGAVIHGAYWHNSFGSQYSHGCVNLPTEEARTLYNWTPLGTKVIVK